jgi:hypothetical protein
MSTMDDLFVDALAGGGYVPEDAMTYGDSTISDNGEKYARPPTASRDSLVDEISEDFDSSLVDTDKPRSKKAETYEKKVRSLFGLAFAATAENPRTVADSAAILLYGPEISKSAGDLAVENTAAAKIIDFLADTTDNAALALLSATVPFILQIAMNHEPATEVETTRIIRVFGREFRPRVIIKLGRLRPFAHDPQELIHKAYSDEAVKEAVLRKKLKIPGITVQR